MIAAFATAQGQDETLPERETFTFPAQMKGLAKVLEEAGIDIVDSPNGISNAKRNHLTRSSHWRDNLQERARS